VGAGVHLATLAFLTYRLDVDYLLATVLAIESSVVHNFVWHQLWTWRDRRADCLMQVMGRLVRFHLCNGLISTFGNLLIMKGMVDYLQVPVVISGLAAISVCAIANFVVGDRLVFRGSEPQTLTRPSA
jgi:putative flippase GtrA